MTCHHCIGSAQTLAYFWADKAALCTQIDARMRHSGHMSPISKVFMRIWLWGHIHTQRVSHDLRPLAPMALGPHQLLPHHLAPVSPSPIRGLSLSQIHLLHTVMRVSMRRPWFSQGCWKQCTKSRSSHHEGQVAYPARAPQWPHQQAGMTQVACKCTPAGFRVHIHDRCAFGP